MIRIIGGFNTNIERIKYIDNTILSLINQSVKFDKIYIVVKFNNIDNIPKIILNNDLFEVINSNNNYIKEMLKKENNLNSSVISLKDDIIYNNNFVEELLNIQKKI